MSLKKNASAARFKAVGRQIARHIFAGSLVLLGIGLSIAVVDAQPPQQGPTSQFLSRKGTGSIQESVNYYNANAGVSIDPTTLACVGESCTLPGWLQRFGFPVRQSGETLQEWRDRTRVAVYANEIELNLGRELGCSQFVDGYDSAGSPLMGVACYVTNYGEKFSDTDFKSALRDAVNGLRPKNTVCITYRPHLPPDQRVSFYVFDEKGNLSNWAQLDFQGARLHPGICTNCHGGTYDAGAHVVINGRFLPVNVPSLKFPEEVPGLSRDGQQERLRRINEMAMHTPLTPAQRDFIKGMYPDGVEKSGSKAVAIYYDIAGNPGSPVYVPPGWSGNPDVYAKVILRSCATCHQALDQNLDFTDFNQFLNLKGPIERSVCIQYDMPHSQAAYNNFWSSPDAVSLLEKTLDIKCPPDVPDPTFGPGRPGGGYFEFRFFPPSQPEPPASQPAPVKPPPCPVGAVC